MCIIPSQVNIGLEKLLKTARSHKMTSEERFEQRVSWVYGQLPEESTTTKEEIRQRLRENT